MPNFPTHSTNYIELNNKNNKLNIERKKEKDNDEDNILLRSAGLFGANNSGKTNLLSAITFFYNVFNSPDNINFTPKDNTDVNKFAHVDLQDQSSEIEFCLYLKGDFYYYGLVFNSKGFLGEYLFKNSFNYLDMIFDDTTPYPFMTPSLTLTGPNHHTEFQNVYDFFTKNLIILNSDSDNIEKLKTLYKHNNKTIVLDDFGRGLHTNLTLQIIDSILFKGNCQFIFSSHCTKLIDLKLFRLDQIVFIDKVKNSSKLTYLSEYRKRFKGNPDYYNLPNIERYYLEGIFGGVPYLSNSILDLD